MHIKCVRFDISLHVSITRWSLGNGGEDGGGALGLGLGFGLGDGGEISTDEVWHMEDRNQWMRFGFGARV